MPGLSSLDHRQFRRILIIKPSSLGDVVHALPVLHGLRQRYPHARISWLISTSCMGLIEGHPELDEIIPFDRRRYGKVGRSWSVTREFTRFALDLRARQFDLVLDLQGLFRSGFFAWISGAGVRMGFTSTREFGWIFHSHRVYVPPRDMHAVDINYLFAQRLGFAETPIRFDLPIQEQARVAVAAHARPEEGVRPGQPICPDRAGYPLGDESLAGRAFRGSRPARANRTRSARRCGRRTGRTGHRRTSPGTGRGAGGQPGRTDLTPTDGRLGRRRVRWQS